MDRPRYVRFSLHSDRIQTLPTFRRRSTRWHPDRSVAIHQTDRKYFGSREEPPIVENLTNPDQEPKNRVSRPVSTGRPQHHDGYDGYQRMGHRTVSVHGGSAHCSGGSDIF
jgi:hypothetical protein